MVSLFKKLQPFDPANSARFTEDEIQAIMAIKKDNHYRYLRDLSYDGIIRVLKANSNHTPWSPGDINKLKHIYPNIPTIITSFLAEIGNVTLSYGVADKRVSINFFNKADIDTVINNKESIKKLFNTEIGNTCCLLGLPGVWIDLNNKYVGKFSIFTVDNDGGVVFIKMHEDFKDLLLHLVSFNYPEAVLAYGKESDATDSIEDGSASTDISKPPTKEHAEGETEESSEEQPQEETEKTEEPAEASETTEGEESAPQENEQSTDEKPAEQASEETSEETPEDQTPEEAETAGQGKSILEQIRINRYNWADVQKEYDTLEDFINAISQESCVNCGQSSYSSTSTITNTIKNIATGEGTIATVSHDGSGKKHLDEDGGGDKFTFNKGENNKEIVQLTGPLSEIYTRALNIYYRKRPVLNEEVNADDIPQDEREQLLKSMMLSNSERDIEDKASAAMADMQSMQQDSDYLHAVVADVVDNKLVDDENYIFLNESELSASRDPINTIVNIQTVTDALKPDIIDTITENKENNDDKNVILVVTGTDEFYAQGTSPVKLTYMDTEENETVNPSLPDYGVPPEEVVASTESLYRARGITVVREFSGFIKYLNERAK